MARNTILRDVYMDKTPFKGIGSEEDRKSKYYEELQNRCCWYGVGM